MKRNIFRSAETAGPSEKAVEYIIIEIVPGDLAPFPDHHGKFRFRSEISAQRRDRRRRKRIHLVFVTVFTFDYGIELTDAVAAGVFLQNGIAQSGEIGDGDVEQIVIFRDVSFFKVN